MKLAKRKTRPAKESLMEVIGARQASAYSLRISFGDGTCRTVDFGAFLHGSSSPLIRAFLDPKRFAAFKVVDGDLMWGYYELCCPVADLYEGRIS